MRCALDGGKHASMSMVDGAGGLDAGDRRLWQWPAKCHIVSTPPPFPASQLLRAHCSKIFDAVVDLTESCIDAYWLLDYSGVYFNVCARRYQSPL